MLIGLTGLYCSGKNYAGEILAEHGLPVLDLDKLGHIALNKQVKLIRETFGDDNINQDGTVNRKCLGAKVFDDEIKIRNLENIVHPEVDILTSKWINEKKTAHKHLVINAAVLHKSFIFENLDVLIIIHAPAVIRLVRAKKRDGLSYAAEIKRLQRQREFYANYFRNKADIYNIANWGPFNMRDALCKLVHKIGICE